MKHTVHEVRLKNGARGLLIDVPGATVMSFQFHFRAGNRFVADKEVYETAHIMEHMAFGANANFNSEHAYEAEFTKNGAYHNAWTSDMAMCYVADCADFEWERILQLQQLAVCQPRYSNTELEAEKGNVKSELTGYLNNHNRVLWPKIQQLLGEDTYSYWQRIQTIPNVSLKDIKEHHARTHTTDNLRFVIAGKLEGRRSHIQEMLESWELPRGERFDIPRDELESGGPAMIRRKEASNLTFGWSLVLPRELTDEEDDAMGCLNHLLTGTMHSRIYGAARKKGLAYGVFSDTSVGLHDSSWDFGGQVNIDTAEKLFDIIVQQMQAVKEGSITEDELEAAKSYALGRHQMGAQTVAQISGFYAGRFFTDDVVRDYERSPEEIKNITLERMIATAREFIAHDVWAFAGVSCGEKEDLLRLNDKLATLFGLQRV
jgi:predicted Zn-dependent peptidase